MTAPYLHDQIFEDIRRNGPEKPIAPADASRVGQKQPRSTLGETATQFMRGLGRAGINFVTGTPFYNPIIHGPAVEYENEMLDAFWGKPKTGGGRGAALTGELIGIAAMGSAGPKPNKVVDVNNLHRTLELIPIEETAARTVPTVRSPTADEARKIVSALRRRPLDSPESNFLGDLLGPEHVSPDVNTIEDLLNLRAFGSRRGPFGVSGKSNLDIMHETGAAMGDINPIAGADEIPAGTDIRKWVFSQMEDPHNISGKAAQREIHRERLYNDELNNALRDAIIDEGIPWHQQRRKSFAGNAPLDVAPQDPFSMYESLKRILGNRRGEIPIGPTEEQLANIRQRPRLHPDQMSDADVAWATGRDDLLPSEGEEAFRVVSRYGRETRANSLDEALGQAGNDFYLDELLDREGPERFGSLKNNRYMNLEESARDKGAFWRRYSNEWRNILHDNKDFEVLFENRLGEVLPHDEYAKRMSNLRADLNAKYMHPEDYAKKKGSAGRAILGALTTIGAAGTTAAAATKGKKKP